MATPGSQVSRPKPWERQSRVEVTSSPGAEGAAKPWEASRSTSVETVVPESSAGPSQQPATRPWETGQGIGGMANTYRPYYPHGSSIYGNNGMYGGSSMYGNSGMYGSSGMYGYGNSGMYGYGNGGMYGYGNGGMYGYGNGGMYGYGNGGMYGNNGMSNLGMYGRPMLVDPNAPSAWQAMLGGIGSMVHFFGRLSFLVDENAHAVHFFISALLQLLDRFGSLYGELARFILRLLGFRRKESMGNRVEKDSTFDATWQNAKST